MTDETRMAAFGASERACYEYPDDTEVDVLSRTAFCKGAGWAAAEIERLRTQRRVTLSKRDRLDLREARIRYGETKGRAIHMARHHVRNLLRIVGKLRRVAVLSPTQEVT